MCATKTLNTVGKTDDEGGKEKQAVTVGGRCHRENKAEEQTGKELEKTAGWYWVREAVSEFSTPEQELEP